MGPVKFTIIKKLKGNNRFNYTPRYYQGKDVSDEGKHATRFDAYTETYNDNDYSGQWKNARVASRNRNNFELNRTVIYLIILFTFLFLWLIDFDLSIFSMG